MSLVFFLFAIFILMGVSSLSASAGTGIVIRPIHLTLDADGSRGGKVNVINQKDKEVTLQASIFGWQQKKKGHDVLVKSNDIILTPPIMRIGPNEQQTIRYALKSGISADPEREKAYRLVIDELPRSPSSGGGLSLRMRYVLPLFVGGREAEAGPLELFYEKQSDKCVLNVKNSGSRHAKLLSVEAKSNKNTFKFRAPLYILGVTTLALSCPTEMKEASSVEVLNVESDVGNFSIVINGRDARRP
ncbi:fimbrial biogenesis chaperone [Emcibacter nanhaiensis]|uniref:Molecular chaperone n=1 Tax=Emcibacter nanhaiensis TaxID=1505037 RepID=A0A501PIT3_9PROT|nr:fimbria/pilus periplasmic chaperone [Emcibacter nanhaiensis]TPD60017.1 molecular chaperone [Emcibacter nanhaiensis]